MYLFISTISTRFKKSILAIRATHLDFSLFELKRHFKIKSYWSPDIIKPKAMMMKGVILPLLAAFALISDLAYAGDPVWHSIWSKLPKDGASVLKVETQLNKDAEDINGRKAVVPIKVNFLDDGTRSATWYWWVKIDPDKYKDGTVYEELRKKDIADIINLKTLKLPSSGFNDPINSEPFDIPSDDAIMKSQPPGDSPIPGRRSATPVRQNRWQGLTKRADFDNQSNAPRHLRFISLQEDKKNDLDKFTGYKYDRRAGKGARVYVLDSGLNLASTAWDSKGDRSKPEFLYSGLGNSQEPKDLDKKVGHGSCMADLVGGRINGVAKEVEITAVQFDNLVTNANRKTNQEAVIQAISQVVDNTYLRRQGVDTKNEKHVISMSFHLPPRDTPADDAADLAFMITLKELEDRGVGIVANMNNGEKCEDPPCKYGFPNEDGITVLPTLVNVRSGDVSGDPFDDPLLDDHPELTVWAPGDDDSNDGVPCLKPLKDEDQFAGGNSAAAALTAGLMAYHMGNGEVRDEARKLVVDRAYARKENGPKMIWNVIDQ